MSKKKKYHLKPFVKKLIILFIILVIIGFFIGRYLYKQHQLEIYHNSYEYKLIQLGYQEDYQLLLDTLSDDQLDVILTYPYNEFNFSCEPFSINIGNNLFSLDKVKIDIQNKDIRPALTSLLFGK